MKITITDQQALELATYFAAQIHGRVVAMHLWCSSTPAEKVAHPGLYQRSDPDESFREMQRAIRSIRNPLDRSSFISQIRWQFQELRRQRGPETRWQDYKRAVQEHREKEAA